MILPTSFSLSEVLIRYVLQFVDVCTHRSYETYELSFADIPEIYLKFFIRNVGVVQLQK